MYFALAINKHRKSVILAIIGPNRCAILEESRIRLAKREVSYTAITTFKLDEQLVDEQIMNWLLVQGMPLFEIRKTAFNVLQHVKEVLEGLNEE